MSATAKPREIIEEVNKLRSDPAGYAIKIEKYIELFNGPILKIPDMNVQIRTQEGDAPYKETVEYLKSQQPANPMKPSKALCEIAQEILDKIVDSESGEIEESEMEQILDKHGNFSGKFTRAMDFGGFTSEQVVINFMVCDGDPDRTQREPLLGDGLTKVGVAFGKHNIYSTVCVLVSCTDFTNTRESNDTPYFHEEENSKGNEKPKELEKPEVQKQKEEQWKKEEEKKKEENKKEEEKKKLEEKKKMEERRKQFEGTKKKDNKPNQGSGEPYKFPKKNKFFSVMAVNKEELPEGVASMTKRDTIVIEGGKRYKKIIVTKIMLDGTKKVEETKQCLD